MKALKIGVGIVLLSLPLLVLFQPSKEAVEWEPYSEEKLQQAFANNQPVVIDFFAEWCIPCHELDDFTYTDPNVIEALNPFVRLKADVSDTASLQVREWMRRFDLVGVPTILFLDPAGKEYSDTRIGGFLPPKAFIEVVRKTGVLP